jgi:tetratricopeptide (TPR) repeat protein
MFLLWEDVHWIDATSLEFLDFLVERIHQLRALLVITARPEFRSPWTRKPHVKPLKLRRLSRRQNAVLINNVAGDIVLAGELLDQLLYRADGIPLFAEELTKAVLESGGNHPPNVPDRGHGENSRPLITVPATLVGALLERLDRYPAAKKLAQVGAVVGREFSYDILKSIIEKPPGELDEGLAQLTDAGVVLPAGPRSDAIYTFKHALLQEAAYDSLLKGKRKVLHSAVADYLCALPERPVPEVIARHYTAGGLYEKAAQWWRGAGDLARQQGAYRQAVACYRRTIELLHALPPSRASKQAELDCCIAMALPLSAVSDRRLDEARQTAARAVELSEELGARDRMVEAHYGLYLNLYNTAHLDSAFETASRLFALAQEGQNRETRLIAERALGTCLFSLGRFDEAIVHLRGAAAEILEQRYSAARPFPIKHANLISAAYLVWARIISGRPGESAAVLKLLQDIMDGPEDFPTGQAVVHWNLATAYFCGGDRSAVRYHADKAIQCLQRIEIPEYAAPPKILRMWAAPEAGSSVWSDAPSARTYLQAQGIEAGTYLEAPVVFAVAALRLMEAGNPRAAAVLLAEALETARSTNERWFEAELLRLSVDAGLRTGSLDPDKAAERLIEATRIAGDQGAKLFELRAATDLLSLWHEDRRRTDAYIRLAAVYSQYTDGFDLPDLTKAQSLLGR